MIHNNNNNQFHYIRNLEYSNFDQPQTNLGPTVSIEENDGLFFTTNPLSIGTHIKQQALLIHENIYKKGVQLSSRQRKLMA